MYVKTTRAKRGNRTYEYLTLVEAVREGAKVGHRVLFRLGEAQALRRTGELERIIAALQSYCDTELVAARELAAEDAPAAGAVAAVWATWQRVGLDAWFAKVGAERGGEVLGHAVFAMVANRLVAPSSKRRLPEWVEADVVPRPASSRPPWSSTTEPSTPWPMPRPTRRPSCTRRSPTSPTWTCAWCPTTSPPPTSRLGALLGPLPLPRLRLLPRPRSDRPQVVIGLLCTGNGIPIAHHVFAGNTADVSTLPGVLADLQARFGVGRICVVADRG